MKVFKFGGASVKDAEAVKNLVDIVKEENEELVIVVSAMGKITNALEKLLDAYLINNLEHNSFLEDIEKFHLEIVKQLFGNKNQKLIDEIKEIIHQIGNSLISMKRSNTTYDYAYDQVVSRGEYLSTKIVSHCLTANGIKNDWIDVGEVVKTDDKYRRASVQWEESRRLIQSMWEIRTNSVVVTQGFVGKNFDNHFTTLGREGSDFSAAIFANCLDAKAVVIWKDVPGILNADPKFFNNPVKLNDISFHEAIELAYYGATIIHPKTIKPLENKNIPLYVNSFINYKEKGTLINQNIGKDSQIPSYIFMTNQVLISISARDYSFIIEENLSHIFGIFANHGIKINLMQNSAISFSVCVADDKMKIDPVIQELKKSYKVLYNTDLELLTIRHYDQKTIDFLTENKEILVSQKSRHTARMVMRNI